jgi:hypothetical protein
MSNKRDDEDVVGGGVVVFGLYWLVLGVWRGQEVLGLPRDVAVGDPFPQWLVAYLHVLVAWLLINGALWIACFARLRSGHTVPRLGLVATVSSVALVLVHGWFTLTHDAALAGGGMIWGFVDLLTLTREFMPNGASAAGATGFRVGQVVGLVVWLFAVLGVAAEVLRPRFAAQAARAS